MEPLPENEAAPPPPETVRDALPSGPPDLSGHQAVGPTFLEGLKHKTIYRVGLGYAVAAWLLLQVAAIVLPGLGWPAWVMRPVIVTLLTGFGGALLVGWALDRQAIGKSLLPLRAGRRLGFILAALLPAVGTAAFFLFVARPPAVGPRASATGNTPGNAPVKSLAVLPFDNISKDQDGTVFADGVQDEVLTDLAKVADLKVISRTSVMQYKSGTPRNLREIAQALGVANVVEGSVRRAGNLVRVTAQLIDARTDTHLWAEQYDRPLANVFDIQSEIAQAIVAQLQGKKLLGDAEWTLEEAGLRQSVRALEDATGQDPKFFLAWCELSRAHLSLYWSNFDHTPERLASATTAAHTARDLRPGAGEAHLVEGVLLYRGHRDFSGALIAFEAAARLLPNDSEVPYWLCFVLRRQGRWEQSIDQIKHASELDPRNASFLRETAQMDIWTYRYADAVRAIDKALNLDPQNLGYAFTKTFCSLMERADPEPMRQWLHSVPVDSEQWGDTAAEVEMNLALYDKDYPAAARAMTHYRQPTVNYSGFLWPREEQEGTIASLSGEQAAARTSFLAARRSAEEMVKKHPDDAKALLVLASIDSKLGNKQAAIDEGRQAGKMLPVSEDAVNGPYIIQELAAIYARSDEPDRAIALLHTIVGKPLGPSYGYLRLDREWDPIRADARFEALLASAAPKALP